MAINKTADAYITLSDLTTGGWSADTLTANKLRITKTHSSGSMAGGIYYYDGTNDHLLIGQGTGNLWIGANETVGSHMSGATYISAGGGTALYVSKMTGTTRTNYKIVDAQNSKEYPSGSVAGLRMSDGTRLTAGNFVKADGALSYYLITSSMTDAGRPGYDGMGLHLAWDNGNWDTQVYIPNGGISDAKHVMVRGETGSDNTWGNWHTLYDDVNLTKSVVTGLLGSNTYLPLSGGTVTGPVTMTDSTADYALTVENSAKFKQATGGVFRFYNAFTVTASAAGWIKIGTLAFGGGSANNAFICIRRQYSHGNNEVYTFLISNAYNGGMNITQLSGRYNLQYITKLGIDNWANGATCNLYLYYNYTQANTVYVSGIGNFAPIAPETGATVGSDLLEVETCNGFKVTNFTTGGTEVKNAVLIRTEGRIYGGYGLSAPNGSGLYIADSGGTVRQTVHLSNTNALHIGYGTGTAGFNTYINGGTVRFRTNTTLTERMVINNAGNVGIGTSSPSQKLHVSGNTLIDGTLTTTGDQVISSDENLKENISEVTYTVEDIASARAVTFDWKDGSGHSAGSIAQDWEGFAPEFVHDGEEGKTLAYAQLGVANSVVIAKEVSALKERVDALEKENAELRAMMKELIEKLG